MTGIEWTDQTWNPVVGCSRVSEGCRNCYAARTDKRLRGIAREEWRDWTGPNAAYNVRLHPERLAAPLHWRKPRRIFVNSMSDLFHEQVPDEFIDRVFAVMALTPQHTYQVLTKRPGREREYVAGAARRVFGAAVVTALMVGGGAEHVPIGQWPLPNVWLGVSVEDQRRADERIPLLLDTPAAVRFLSCEPLLGPVDLRRSLGSVGLSWCIAGGESGPSARPCNLAWIRGIVEQCQDAGVPAFVKQLGARPVGLPLCDPKGGGDMNEWPADLRVREWPR